MKPVRKKIDTRIPLLTAVGTLLLFFIWTQPLMFHWSEGIPSSASNLESPAWRTAIAGDHLQLLYHFDLAADMVEGRISWFTNPYEFNTGSDEDRFRPGAYFAPMSLLYAVLRPWMGQAAAWNTVLWVSVWMSAWFAWLWLRTFSFHRIGILAGVLIILTAPFRWGSLLGGSPAGIALMWVPFFLWRLNMGMMKPRIRDGFLIGLGLILMFWGDLQVFYLTSLFAPVFALITIGWCWQDLRAVFIQWWKLLPGGVTCLAAIGLFYRWRKTFLSGSKMSEGRTWQELALFSPRPSDLIDAQPGPGETVYVGGVLFLILMVCLCVAVWRSASTSDGVSKWLRPGTCLLAAGTIVFGICLALGTNGPSGGWAIRVARSALPYFDMIRQSFKVFAVVPVLMAWLLAAGTSSLVTSLRAKPRFAKTAVGAGLSILILFPYSRHIHATVSLLPSPQDAYAAVARDAEQRGIETPHILVIPLWPGDSAETSVPMHLAQHYHLRMVNGYSPVVSEAYFNNVFRELESINQGQMSQHQVDILKEMNVDYVIIHTDRFPEKVSPFPIRNTLAGLSRHPNLTPLAQAGPVTAFSLEAGSVDSISKPSGIAPPGIRFPARRYEAERLPGVTSEGRRAEEGTQGGHFQRVSAGQTVSTPPARIAPDPKNHWYLRVRGSGTLLANTVPIADSSAGAQQITVNQTDWTWMKIPLQSSGNFSPTPLELTVQSGEVDLDVLVLSGSEDLLNIPPEGLRLPAAWFFHAGYAGPDGESVFFRPGHDPSSVVWYGPILPLSPGTYRFKLHTRVEKEGSTVGEIRSGYHREEPAHRLPVHGEVVEWEWEVTHSKLWRVEFVYNRSAPAELVALEILPQPSDNPTQR